MGQLLPFIRPPFAAPAARPEVVASLLLAMEEAPLFRAVAYTGLDMAGRIFVAVRADGVTFRLTPAEARLAADTLDAEQAYPDCLTDAHMLRTAVASAASNAVQRSSGRLRSVLALVTSRTPA